MAEPYNFNFKPASPDYDLEELKRSLMSGAQAEQGLEQMQPDIDYATANRDTALPDYHPLLKTRGILNTAAALTNRSQGHRQLRETDPREAELRGEVANAKGQESLFALYNERMKEQRANEKGQLELESHNVDQGNVLVNQKLAQDTENRNAENDKLKRKIDSAPEGDFLGQYYDPATETTIVVANDPKTGLPINASTQEPVNLDNMEFIDNDSANFRGKAWTPTQTSSYANIATQTRQVKKAISEYKPEYAQIDNLPTGFAQDIMKGAERADLMKYFNKDISAKSKEAMLWWADWTKLYTLPERYEAFGATLTDNELKSWATAELMNPGSDPELTRRRMNKLGLDMENKFLNLSDSQLSTVTPEQRSVIRKNTAGLAEYQDHGEFGGPTITWEGKDAFINGTPATEEEVVTVLDEWVEPVPSPYGNSLPQEVWDALEPGEQKGLADLDDINAVIKILHKNGKLTNR